MRKFIIMMFVCLCGAFVSANAQNYTGTLTVYVNDTVQYSGAATVDATQEANKAKLKISSFKILDYATMNVTLDATLTGDQLSTPATVAVTPKLIAFLLGNLKVQSGNLGTLNDAKCAIDMTMNVATKKEVIRVLFTGSVTE